MSNLLRAHCGCIITKGYKHEKPRSEFVTAFVIRDCYNHDFTFRERVIRIDSERPRKLSAEEESEIWSEISKLVDDGHKMRDMRDAFKNVFSPTTGGAQ